MAYSPSTSVLKGTGNTLGKPPQTSPSFFIRDFSIVQFIGWVFSPGFFTGTGIYERYKTRSGPRYQTRYPRQKKDFTWQELPHRYKKTALPMAPAFCGPDFSVRCIMSSLLIFILFLQRSPLRENAVETKKNMPTAAKNDTLFSLENPPVLLIMTQNITDAEKHIAIVNCIFAPPIYFSYYP